MIRRRKSLRRKASLKPRTSTPRKTRVKRVNVTRKAREFARTYHSVERVRFVQGLMCVNCAAWPSENAHLPSRSGAGRKGDYTTIIPLCHACHDRKVYMREMPNRAPDFWSRVASKIEAAWLASLDPAPLAPHQK